MSMADLLAKSEFKPIQLSRGQEVEGEVILVTPLEIILDLGAKSEGVIQKKDLGEPAQNVKVGDKLSAFVIQYDETGQVILGATRPMAQSKNTKGWKKFQTAMTKKQTLTGTGLELNKGGLIVEVEGTRGFLPSSQVALSLATDLDQLIGQKLEVEVIEVDPSQNRLIFSQKTKVTEDIKKHLSKFKVGDKVEGDVAAVLPFGVFVTLSGGVEGPTALSGVEGTTALSGVEGTTALSGVEGLVHISEISWEKVEDPNTVYKVGDKVEAKVLSVDSSTGRVNLSVKQLAEDPFADKVKDFQVDDVVKAEITKVSSQGVSFKLEGGVEGYMPTGKMDSDTDYAIGKSVSCLVDSIDTQKRRVNLVPFLTSTKDLIYK